MSDAEITDKAAVLNNFEMRTGWADKINIQQEKRKKPDEASLLYYEADWPDGICIMTRGCAHTAVRQHLLRWYDTPLDGIRLKHRW